MKRFSIFVPGAHGYRVGDTLKDGGGELLRITRVDGSVLDVEPAPNWCAWLIALAISVTAGAGLVVIGFLVGIVWLTR